MTWAQEFRGPYLDALLALDGRGRHPMKCTNISCPEENPMFRCRDCYGKWMYCEACILHQHRTSPLHWIEVRFPGCHMLPPQIHAICLIKQWNEKFFVSKPLQTFKDYQVQLGHVSGFACPSQGSVVKDFVVIDVNGIHLINLDFCDCPGAPSTSDQLIEVGWWPSTLKQPATAATLNVLQMFLAHNHQGQIVPTDFYKGLEQLMWD